MYKHFIKRFLDIIVALVAIILLSPVFIILAIIIKLKQGGNIFYIQKRPGLKGGVFSAIKFKTMNDKKDFAEILLPDNERITKIGRFLRSSSLDEIPQLINVIKGNMSIIGPRPLLVKYLPLYSDFQNRRHEVRPGITGWAQVNGRNNISWQKKFEYDVWYVDNLTLWLDIKILLLTLKKVFYKEGVVKNGFATTEAFNGKN